MRISPKLWLFTAESVFSALVSAPFALAASEAKDCPAPTRNVSITSGIVFYGPNCAVSPAGDVDSFQFNGKTGERYRLAAAMDGSGYPNNICLDLYDPYQTKIFSGCSDSYWEKLSVATDQTLTLTGTYRMLISEQQNDAPIKYGTSLERLYPAPPDGRPFVLAPPQPPVSDELNPITDMDAFTVFASVDSTYHISASIGSGGYPSNVCFDVFGPNGTPAGPPLCTDSYWENYSIAMDLKPLQTGTQVVVVYEQSYDGTVGYNFNITCVGPCPTRPQCRLTDTLSYDANSDTLTMTFSVWNQYPVTWNGWLTYQNTMEPLWSMSQPITDPAATVIKTRTNLPKAGKVGVLSTLTTPGNGITCQSWAMVNTK